MFVYNLVSNGREWFGGESTYRIVRVTEVDLTVRMVIALLVERIVNRKINTVHRPSRTIMIDHNINHKIHPTLMQRISQILQILLRPKLRIYLIQIPLPVSMIRIAISSFTAQLGCDRRDPDGIEAHVLDVVEVVLDSFESPAAVEAVGGVARGRGAAICACEAVGEDLVDAPACPLGAGGCEACLGERQAQCYEMENHVVFLSRWL